MTDLLSAPILNCTDLSYLCLVTQINFLHLIASNGHEYPAESLHTLGGRGRVYRSSNQILWNQNDRSAVSTQPYHMTWHFTNGH